MANYIIRERCPCGASFEMESTLSTLIIDSVDSWRKNHKHPTAIAVADAKTTSYHKICPHCHCNFDAAVNHNCPFCLKD